MRHRLCACACAVAALIGSQTLITYAYATFGKWLVTPVLIYANPQNNDVSASAAEAALLVGMNAWNNEGQAKFSFVYAGRVNDTTIGYDSRNVVIFRNTVGESGSTIAATYTWSNAGIIVDADVVFYDASFTFVTGNGPCTGNGVFIEDIAAHEFGHVLGLSHSTDPAATMLAGYPYCSQEFRTLAPDDIAGIQSLYGAASPSNTRPTVTITSPANGLSITSGTAITFSGTASDAQDGNMTSSLKWTSTLDGVIGNGGSFTKTLSAGVHVITASVTDKGGLTGTAVVNVTVTVPVVPPPPGTGTNVALASAGATASASSTYSSGFPASAVINGDRAGKNWGNGGVWGDGTPNSFPDWVQVDFAGSYSIGQVNVFSVQDNYPAPSDPTATQTFFWSGARAFEVQYWTGTAWATIPGTTVTGNTLVWRTVTFTPVTTQKIRVVITSSADARSWLTEVEAFTGTASSQPTRYTYSVVRQYPHDTGAFTQGFELKSGSIYESTGLNGSSSLRQVDLLTGSVLKKVDVPSQYFAEGLTIIGTKIYQLTWQSQVGFIYDLNTFAKTGQFSYTGEGWGLTHDSQYLIMSDGTSQIRFIDPTSFQTIRSITVLDGSAPVTQINELEYVNGEIYANIWQTNSVARIDPATGRVTGWIDLSGLLPPGTSADVLNGIAYDSVTGHLLVTGKFWPSVFEITLLQVTP